VSADSGERLRRLGRRLRSDHPHGWRTGLVGGSIEDATAAPRIRSIAFDAAVARVRAAVARPRARWRFRFMLTARAPRISSTAVPDSTTRSAASSRSPKSGADVLYRAGPALTSESIRGRRARGVAPRP
jgi:2-methylisocitrate lyase-like PEP mutase family enzyme